MKKIKGYQKFNEELSPATYKSAGDKMWKNYWKKDHDVRSKALKDFGREKEALVEEELKELDEFVRVQLQDIDPDKSRFQYEAYANIPGRRTLAGKSSDWNIALILDTSEDYDGIDLSELWPILEGMEEYLKYHCKHLHFERLVGTQRGAIKPKAETLIDDEHRNTDNWQWVGAKFSLK